MNNFITILKLDYLQRTRSYSFLITLCISFAVAYSFIPSPDANYSTIRIGDYLGYYNSSWIGYVSAIMTSIFLSLIGFYLVNGCIKKDGHSKIGQIIATTRISNFAYLFSKTISNFLVLFTIAVFVLLMSIVLFFLYRNNFPFELLNFLIPYSVIVTPSLFFIATLAVLFEAIFGQKTILQNILFFFLFFALITYNPVDIKGFYLDVFGTKIITTQMENTVRDIIPEKDLGQLTIGYILDNTSKHKNFIFNGVDFSLWFIVSRLGWMSLGVLFLGITSIFFHRFNIKERLQKKNKKIILETNTTNTIDISKLPKASFSFSIVPLIKTEFFLLVRTGYLWLWILNFAGMLALLFAPLSIAHQIVLPVLWFLQVARWSTLVTKERMYNTHFFTFASYQPLKRLLFSQIIAGVLFAIFLSVPLLIRYWIQLDFMNVASILLGSVFIISLAVLTGILSKRKKLFEILFFMVTYANINGIPFMDYYGGLHENFNYLITIFLTIVIALIITYSVRNFELKRV